jgi:hypothetical protein
MHNCIPSLFTNMKWIKNCVHWHSNFKVEKCIIKTFLQKLFIEMQIDYKSKYIAQTI